MESNFISNSDLQITCKFKNCKTVPRQSSSLYCGKHKYCTKMTQCQMIVDEIQCTRLTTKKYCKNHTPTKNAKNQCQYVGPIIGRCPNMCMASLCHIHNPKSIAIRNETTRQIRKNKILLNDVHGKCIEQISTQRSFEECSTQQ